MASRKLVVEVVGDSRSLERAFGRSSKAASNFGRDLERNARRTRGVFAGIAASLGSLARSGPFAAVFGGAAAVVGIDKMVDAASNLNEQINRSNVVFTKSAAEIVAWSKTTANAIGVSQAEALEAAGNFGTMFDTIGLGVGDSADMSQALVTLGADMASFNNQDPTEMLDRLRAGLSGEAEPLRRFGILLSEARVKQEAYRSGIARQGSTLTEAQKVQARYNLILRDSALQQGDFARTSDSLANQQRILSAQLGDLAAKLGAVLLPYVTDLVTKMTEWLSNTENQERLTRALKDAVEFLKTAIQKIVEAIPVVIQGFTDMLDWFRKFWIEMQIMANEWYLRFLEIFSRIPEFIGGALGRLRDFAQQAKTDVVSELWDLQSQAAVIGSQTGDAFGANMVGALNEHLAIMNRATKAATPKGAKAPRLPSLITGARLPALTAAKKAGGGGGGGGPKGPTAAEKRAAAQMAALGFGPGGEALVPGLPALRNVFDRITQAMKTASPKLKSQTKKLMEAIRKILAGGMGKVSEEVRRKIQQLLADLDKKLKGGGAQTRQQHFRKANIDATLAGLGLTPEQIRILRGRMAGSTGGKAPLGGQAAFGQRVGAGATIVNINGNVVTPDSDKFLRDMQKRAKRSKGQQRGVRPGANLGIA